MPDPKIDRAYALAKAIAELERVCRTHALSLEEVTISYDPPWYPPRPCYPTTIGGVRVDAPTELFDPIFRDRLRRGTG